MKILQASFKIEHIEDKEMRMFLPENPDENFYTNRTIQGQEIGYPVHVYYIELSKMYMQRIRWHWHPELEIMIINHGEAMLITDDEKLYLKPGQGVIINQNVMHSLQPVDAKADCSLYTTIFHPNFLFGYGNTLISGKFMAPIINSPVFKTMLLDESNPAEEKLIDTVNSIIATNMTKKYGYELITKSYLCQFWVQLLEQIVPQNKNSNQNTLSLDEMRVKEAIMYIEEHYFEHISLEQLADSVHISKSECCRCFKRTLQLTPIEYLMKYRIFKASTLIQSNDPIADSISTLALSVGFNNVSYFNKIFKQYLKCTPREYKKGVNNNPDDSVFTGMTI